MASSKDSDLSGSADRPSGAMVGDHSERAGGDEQHPGDPPAREFTVLDAWLMASITLLAGFLRILRVGDPRRLMFDEVYYAKDACYYAQSSLEACRIEDLNEVHPPLGKWIISVGIKLFGFDSFGYRSMAVLGGTLTIALTYLLARKILRSTLGAGVASGLLAIDPLHFVQSRISMLDIFVPLFAVAGLLFLVFARDRAVRVRDSVGALPTKRDDDQRALAVPWLAAAGIAGGAAVASKWMGVFVPLAALALAVTWALSARRPLGKRAAVSGALRNDAVPIVLCLVALPVVVYCASYIGRDVGGEVLALPWAEGSWFRALWERQWEILDFHRSLDATHPYQSQAWSWILIKRPVSYFFETDPNGDYREILATGSPFVWWASIPAVLYVAYAWIKSRSLRRPEGVILAGFLFSYGVWLLPTTSRSAVFLFYFVATVPFLCLAIGYVASVLGNEWEARTAITLFCVTAVAFFAFYYPLLTKQAISQEQWDRRIWFFDMCDKPKGGKITTMVETTQNGSVLRTETTEDSNKDRPPTGWCWI